MDLVELQADNPNRHPWELSRARCSLKILDQFDHNLSYADVGAGDIYFATRVAETIGHDVYAVDIEYPDARKEGPVQKLTNIADLPEDGVDVVLLMDVIEHVEDVDAFFEQLLTRVKPGGQFFITVPAWQFLFSIHDVFLKHYRRYNFKMLKETLDKHNIEIESSFYFYTTLFFARMLSKLFEKFQKTPTDEGIGAWGFAEDHFVTKTIFTVLNLDFDINRLLYKIGIKLPGLSLCAVCRRKTS